jgi:DNA-binding NtrC family response regulator
VAAEALTSPRYLAPRLREALRDTSAVLIHAPRQSGKTTLARAVGEPRGYRYVSFDDEAAVIAARQDRAGFVADLPASCILDEVGALPKPAQVKLLRALHDGEILQVGSSRRRRVDVQVIAATNRSLLAEVTAGNFREDLFHRLAVAVLHLPPLRERGEDLPLLIDHVLAQVDREGREQPGFVEKKLSAGARNPLLGHSWPGNVRELQNTLRRAAIWTSDATLKAEDIREALLALPGAEQDGIVGRPLGEGLDLPGLLATVARHYLERALDEAAGNKTRAARLVGLPSYQTLTNWMKRYGVTA